MKHIQNIVKKKRLARTCVLLVCQTQWALGYNIAKSEFGDNGLTEFGGYCIGERPIAHSTVLLVWQLH